MRSFPFEDRWNHFLLHNSKNGGSLKSSRKLTKNHFFFVWIQVWQLWQETDWEEDFFSCRWLWKIRQVLDMKHVNNLRLRNDFMEKFASTPLDSPNVLQRSAKKTFGNKMRTSDVETVEISFYDPKVRIAETKEKKRECIKYSKLKINKNENVSTLNLE